MVEFTGSNGSGLDTSVYGSALTKVLNKIAPGQGADAYQLAQLLTPAPREISGAELALQFFSNMAANASQPGATVLSSAASAVKPTADEYIRQVEANRKSREATGPLAVSLAKALKPAKATKPTIGGYTLVKDIEGVGKAGDPLTMSNVVADAFVAKHGIGSIKEFKTPLVNIGDKAAETEMAKAAGKNAAAEMELYRRAYDSASSTITDLDTMYTMLSEVDEDGSVNERVLESGPFQNYTLRLQALGVSLGLGGPDMEQQVTDATGFNSLVNKVTLGTVGQLKGPLSEKELGFLQAVQPYLGNTVNGNKLIILIQKHAAEKALNYGKFFSKWRNTEVDGKLRGFPKTPTEHLNMIDAWKSSDEFRLQLPEYISNMTKEIGQALQIKDEEEFQRTGRRKYTLNPSGGLTEEGSIAWATDINKRVPMTALNTVLRKQNVSKLFLELMEELNQ
jgi:hypothetical protein